MVIGEEASLDSDVVTNEEGSVEAAGNTEIADGPAGCQSIDREISISIQPVLCSLRRMREDHVVRSIVQEGSAGTFGPM